MKIEKGFPNLGHLIESSVRNPGHVFCFLLSRLSLTETPTQLYEQFTLFYPLLGYVIAKYMFIYQVALPKRQPRNISDLKASCHLSATLGGGFTLSLFYW